MPEKKLLQYAEMHQNTPHTHAGTLAHPLAHTHTLAQSLVLVFNLFALSVR